MSSDHSTPRIPTVAYYRMSDDKQEHSIATQKAWAKRKEAEKGLAVRSPFEDEGIAGDVMELRPGFLAMIAYCQQQHKAGTPIEVLLCYDGDRFSRADSFDTTPFLSLLRKAGVSKMVTAQREYDFDNVMDRMMFNIEQEAGRAAYSKLLSARVAEATVREAKAGRWTGGRPPHGYIVGDDRHLAKDAPEKGEAATWLFEQYDLTETSLKRLADEATRRGYPPPGEGRKGTKGCWTKYSVWTILTNPNYTGDLHIGRHCQGKYHTLNGGQVIPHKPKRTKRGYVSQVDNPPELVIITPNAHPGLVSRERFERVQRKLASHNLNEAGRGKPRRNLDFPLSGKLCCKDCGRVMHAISLKPGRGRPVEVRQYVCATYREEGKGACSYNNVPEKVILPAVFEAIRWRFSDPETVAALREACQEARQRRGGDDAARLRKLDRRIAELTKQEKGGFAKLARLPDKLADGMQAEILGWQAEREALEQEKEQLQRASDAAEEEDDLVEEALAAFAELGELIHLAADSQEATQAVQAYVERIELTFTHEERGKRRFSRCTSATVHFRPLGEVVLSHTVSLVPSSWENVSPRPYTFTLADG